MSKKATKAHTTHHLSKATRAKISRSLKSFNKKHHSRVARKTHTGSRAKKVGLALPGEYNMCAFTAAGLVTGGNAFEAYMDYGAPADGATIPEALNYMGMTPVEAVNFTPGTILSYSIPDAFNHAVTVEDTEETGVWVWSWGELHFLTWDFVDKYAEEMWLA